MGVYELMKNCINVAQNVGNIPLVTNLIEAQKQILDLQNENNKLRYENGRYLCPSCNYIGYYDKDLYDYKTNSLNENRNIIW